MKVRMLHSDGREGGLDIGDSHWSNFPAGSHEREEALFLEAMRMNIAPSYLHSHIGVRMEEVGNVARRLLAKGKLSNLSRYARLIASTRKPLNKRHGGKREKVSDAAE